MTQSPIILWLRRDFRLADNPALWQAAQSGRPVIPVFILDEVAEARGAAPMWRLEQSLKAFAQSLAPLGARLVLRRGPARDVLDALLSQTGSDTVYWGRDIAPEAVARDREIKEALTAKGVTAKSFPGLLLWEPWTVTTQDGGPYRVYSPFWKRARQIEPEAPCPAPGKLAAPDAWPPSDDLADWALDARMNRGAAVLARYAEPAGEAAALKRLDTFLEDTLHLYKSDRDRMDLPHTSRLSAYLALGEISPRTIWAASHRAAGGGKPMEKFLSEVAWREFAYHLMFNAPDLARKNWKPGWDAFPWQADNPAAERWKRGQTGVAIVDAAMREMYVTGMMHNRARMICASYLTKHLMTDWRVGLKWFEECLVDWDPASNAMGWQWVAGCGPDAAPFFRIFNPDTQAEKFDPEGTYRRRYLEGAEIDSPAGAFFEAAPRSWGLAPGDPVPEPAISLPEGRARALAAYEALPRPSQSAA